MSCRAFCSAGSRARGTNENSSSSRTRTMRSAMSSSGAGGIELAHLAGLHAVASSTSAVSRARSSERSISFRASARWALPAACTSRKCSVRVTIPRRSAPRGALRVLVQQSDLHVRVAPPPERVGQALDVAQHALVGLGRKARREDLQYGPQAPGGYAHVVHTFDVAVSSTPSEWSHTSWARMATTRRAAAANGSPPASSGMSRALAITLGGLHRAWCRQGFRSGAVVGASLPAGPCRPCEAGVKTGRFPHLHIGGARVVRLPSPRPPPRAAPCSRAGAAPV